MFMNGFPAQIPYSCRANEGTKNHQHQSASPEWKFQKLPFRLVFDAVYESDLSFCFSLSTTYTYIILLLTENDWDRDVEWRICVGNNMTRMVHNILYLGHINVCHSENLNQKKWHRPQCDIMIYYVMLFERIRQVYEIWWWLTYVQWHTERM